MPQGEHGCIYCTDSTGPYAWLVEIDGIANYACQSCANWNGAYILTPDSNDNCWPVTENTACCCWTAPDGGDACEENEYPYYAGEYAQVTLQVCDAYDLFDAGIRVRMFHALTGGYLVWEHNEETPIDCLGVSGLNVPFGEIPPSLCDADSSTCTLTALV